MDKQPLPAVKKVMQNGNSLTVNVTQECKILGIQRGECVRITIERF